MTGNRSASNGFLVSLMEHLIDGKRRRMAIRDLNHPKHFTLMIQKQHHRCGCRMAESPSSAVCSSSGVVLALRAKQSVSLRLEVMSPALRTFLILLDIELAQKHNGLFSEDTAVDRVWWINTWPFLPSAMR